MECEVTIRRFRTTVGQVQATVGKGVTASLFIFYENQKFLPEMKFPSQHNTLDKLTTSQ